MRRMLLAALLACLLLLSACAVQNPAAAPSEPTPPVNDPPMTTLEETPSQDENETAPQDELQPFSQTLPEELSAVLNAQRQSLMDAGGAGVHAPLAVTLLGILEGDLQEGLPQLLKESRISAQYPYLAALPEDHIVDAGGYEVYLLLPLGDDAGVTVNRWAMDEENTFAGEKGEALYQSTFGDPILLRCNVSDLMPNASVTVIQSGAEDVIDYTPQISLRNGAVVTTGLIQDKTNHLLMAGRWAGQITLTSGAVCDVTLEFGWDNSLYFTCDSGPDTGVSRYEGTWFQTVDEALADYRIAFDCALTRTEGNMGAPEQLRSTFYAELSADWMELYYLAGDELVPGASSIGLHREATP